VMIEEVEKAMRVPTASEDAVVTIAPL